MRRSMAEERREVKGAAEVRDERRRETGALQSRADGTNGTDRTDGTGGDGGAVRRQKRRAAWGLQARHDGLAYRGLGLRPTTAGEQPRTLLGASLSYKTAG